MGKKITSLVPKGTFELEKKELTAIIQDSSSDSIHVFANNMKILASSALDIAKGEMLKRIQDSDKNSIETSLGKISMVTRKNFTVDEEKAIKVCEKNNIAKSEYMKAELVVITHNQKVIDAMIEKGYIGKKETLVTKNISKLAETYDDLSACIIEDDPSYSLRGL